MPTLTYDDIQLMNVLEKRTGARAKDIVVTPDEVIFVVEKGDLGRAIGKQGANVTRLKQALNKKIEMEINQIEKTVPKDIKKKTLQIR